LKDIEAKKWVMDDFIVYYSNMYWSNNRSYFGAYLGHGGPHPLKVKELLLPHID